MAHIPVMLKESLEVFKGKKISLFFDGTLGAGGFAKALLSKHPEIKTYFGCDQDRKALALAGENLGEWKEKVTLIHGNFSHLDQYLDERGVKQVDGFFLTWGCRPCN